MHAVTGGAVHDAHVGHLARRGRADGPAVVLHHEHNRCLVDGREVEGLVKVALAGAAVADEGEHHPRPLLLVPARHGEPDRVRHLRGDGDVEGQHAHVVREAPTGRVRTPVKDGLTERQAVSYGGGRLAVTWHQPVTLLEGECGTDLGGLLAAIGGVDAKATLALEGNGPLVEEAGAGGGAVAAEEFLCGEG